MADQDTFRVQQREVGEDFGIQGAHALGCNSLCQHVLRSNYNESGLHDIPRVLEDAVGERIAELDALQGFGLYAARHQ